MMDFRHLQGRLLQICEGSFVVRLRSPTSGRALAEADVRIPVSQHTRAEGLIEFDVREDFARDFVGPNVVRQELLEESKPSASATLEHARKELRRLQAKFHPDRSAGTHAQFFSAVEVSADLNSLAESLRMVDSKER